MKRLAIITTHPIQYNAPFFKLLKDRGRIKMKVFYTWGKGVLHNKYDPGFDKVIEWDIPLLEGYDYCFVENISTSPGSHHFTGIDNPSLNKEIEAFEADAVLVFGWSFKSHLRLLRRFKKKIIFRGDSNLLDEEPGFALKKTARRIFLRWIYSHVDKALYVGTANKNYYLKYGLKREQLVFAPHAIDNNRFMQDVDSDIRETTGIPSNAVVFIFTGKLETKKNPQLLLDAFTKLDQAGSYLLFVGNGELELSLKESSRRQPAEISKRIFFLPFQNQLKMPEVYRAGDILVLPSQGPGETWGLSVNEAMASSRAVLVSDKCGCAGDLVEEGKNGYVFKNRNCDDLVEKMQSLLMQRKKLLAMGGRSREIIQSWNFEQICEAVEHAIKD